MQAILSVYLVWQLCWVDLFSVVYSYSYFFSDFFKINFFFYLSYLLRLLLIVCGDIESNPDPGSDWRVGVIYSYIRGRHANLDELAVAGSDYGVLVCAESKVSDRRHLSEHRIPGFGFPHQRLRDSHLVPRVWLFMLGKDSALSSRASWSVLATSLVHVFRICKRINNFYVHAFYCNPGRDGSLYDCLLDSMARVKSVDDIVVFVFVSDANAHHSEW